MSAPSITRSSPLPNFRLRPVTRKWALLTHIVSAGAWIGIDIVLGILVFTAMLTDDSATRIVCAKALGLFAVWPMAISGLICLLSGIVLGLGSKYGLLKYWWVAVKLVANVVLLTLVVFLLRPGIDQLGAGRDNGVGHLFMPPIVSLTALLVASVLSVFKPWGRTVR